MDGKKRRNKHKINKKNIETSDLSNSDKNKKFVIDSDSDSEEEEDFMSKDKILASMIARQLKNVPSYLKLSIRDMNRICKFVDTNMFGDNCCFWTGHISNVHNASKGTYINFYFRGKKVALHRLLYSNFVSSLDSSEYLKFKCPNRGFCCNSNHYEKYKYSKIPVNKNRKKPKTKFQVLNGNINGMEILFN